jgi:hypothetical protein
MRFPVFLYILILSLLSCNKGTEKDKSCNGNTRRDVKLLIDASRNLVDTTPVSISLKDIGELSVPEVKRETDRLELEYKVYSVRATVDKVDVEADGDTHIRLTDGDNYLITECPNPNCEYALGSAYLNAFQTIRNFIDANDLEGKEVTITGVAFVDIDHHYKRKQAKNNIELHPILRIEW